MSALFLCGAMRPASGCRACTGSHLQGNGQLCCELAAVSRRIGEDFLPLSDRQAVQSPDGMADNLIKK